MDVSKDLVEVTLPNGTRIHRGQAILVQHESEVRTAIVSRIGESGGEPVVSANIMTAEFYAARKGQPAWEYQEGFRHVSTKIPHGKQFCTVAEGQDGLRKLRGDFADAVPDTEVDHFQDADTNQPVPDPDQERADQVYNKRDLNKDGMVTEEEREEYKRLKKLGQLPED
jgi:hypothetical protein